MAKVLTEAAVERYRGGTTRREIPDAPAQPACHAPKPQVEMHTCLPRYLRILGIVASVAQTRDFQPLLRYIQRR